jgi:hypothetical protein
MEIYCGIEEGLNRYLDEVRLAPSILLKIGCLDPPAQEEAFFKSECRNLKAIRLECEPDDFEFLFTESFDRGKYIGELAEDFIIHALFKYIQR